MIICGLDFEATGLDTAKERIIECGLAIWDTEENTPVHMYSTLVDPGDEFRLLGDIVKYKTKIKPEWLYKYGVSPPTMLHEMNTILKKYAPKVIVGHNLYNYDKPLLDAELARWNIDNHQAQIIPCVDSRTDLPFAVEPESRKLNHLATDHHFLNPWPHRALMDVLTMLKIVSHYDIEEIIEQSKIPWSVIQCQVGYDDRQKAKDARFNWENIGTENYPKKWVKKIRLNKLELEQELAFNNGYEIARLK